MVKNMVPLEIIKKLMTEAGIKYQIQSHPDLEKFGRIHHVIVTNKPDTDGTMTLDDFVERCTDEYNEYIGEVKSAVTAAVRSGNWVSNQIILFSDSALLQLRELTGLAKTLDDEYFIISFAEQTSETTGLKQFVQPVISVIDVSEEEPINLIALNLITPEKLKFVVKNVGYNCYYSAYDILDMLSIGNQVTLSKESKYFTLSEIRRECMSGIYEYQCLEFWSSIRIDPKLNIEDINSIVLEANQKLSEQEIFTCKSCGRHYTISEDERKWYADRKFNLPKRCSSCRYDERQKRRHDERAEEMKAYYRELGFGVLDCLND
jgi:hypothetical protein